MSIQELCLVIECMKLVLSRLDDNTLVLNHTFIFLIVILILIQYDLILSLFLPNPTELMLCFILELYYVTVTSATQGL